MVKRPDSTEGQPYTYAHIQQAARRQRRQRQTGDTRKNCTRIRQQHATLYTIHTSDVRCRCSISALLPLLADLTGRPNGRGQVAKNTRDTHDTNTQTALNGARETRKLVYNLLVVLLLRLRDAACTRHATRTQDAHQHRAGARTHATETTTATADNRAASVVCLVWRLTLRLLYPDCVDQFWLFGHVWSLHGGGGPTQLLQHTDKHVHARTYTYTHTQTLTSGAHAGSNSAHSQHKL